jgi:hypothetical protein
VVGIAVGHQIHQGAGFKRSVELGKHGFAPDPLRGGRRPTADSRGLSSYRRNPRVAVVQNPMRASSRISVRILKSLRRLSFFHSTSEPR